MALSKEGKLRRIISFANGANDFAILDLSQQLGFKTGGNCQWGIKKDLVEQYGLKRRIKPTQKPIYPELRRMCPNYYAFKICCESNVRYSDATLIFGTHGTEMQSTITRFAVSGKWHFKPFGHRDLDCYEMKSRQKQFKKVFVVNDATTERSKNGFREFLIANQVRSLFILPDSFYPIDLVISFLRSVFEHPSIKPKPN